MRTGVRTCIVMGGMRPREEVDVCGSRGAMALCSRLVPRNPTTKIYTAKCGRRSQAQLQMS